MTRTHLIAVGACAVDNILTVPHYPEEDSKLRAVSLTKRRGGNCPNSLEVLSQLVNSFTINASKDTALSKKEPSNPADSCPKLSLIATLPSRSSLQIPFIISSFVTREESIDSNAISSIDSRDSIVDISRCIYREEFTEPISSYIICSQATSSRTIVNHNELPEMTVDEFIDATDELLDSTVLSGGRNPEDIDQLWFHFEGRIPETTLKCIQYLRNQFTTRSVEGKVKLRISVELEKPKREGLQELAFEADVVFYSKSWAEAEGHQDAESCLMGQADLLTQRGTRFNSDQTLVCTWGSQGACALHLTSDDSHTSTKEDYAVQKVLHSSAYISLNEPVLDTVGAGDTFIAGILFSFICRESDDEVSHGSIASPREAGSEGQPAWSLEQKLDFANGLAGRKVVQYGFQGLAEKIHDLVKEFDHTSSR